jgi:biotin carboxyl carrier protein
MKLLVTIGGRRGQIELEREGGRCRFTYTAEDGAPVTCEASVIEVEPGIFSILIGGRSYESKVVPAPDGYYVDLAGHRAVVEVRDPRSAVRRHGAGVAEGRQNIAAPMPGKVVRVLVKEGDTVEQGCGLVVVEAMKMQNEMKAPRAGRIAQMNAREGSTVGAGDVLLVIE